MLNNFPLVVCLSEILGPTRRIATSCWGGGFTVPGGVRLVCDACWVPLDRSGGAVTMVYKRSCTNTDRNGKVQKSVKCRTRSCNW